MNHLPLKSPKPLYHLNKPQVKIMWEKFLPSLIGAVARSYGVSHDSRFTSLHGALIGRQWARAVDIADILSSTEYETPHEHFAWNQLASLVRKVPFQDPLLTPRETAWKKFQAAEQACKSTNERISSLRDVHFYTQYIECARSWIAKVIGVQPNYSAIWEGCDFGPGSSIGVGGLETHSAEKLEGQWTVSPGALFYARSAVCSNMQMVEFLLSEGDSKIFCLDPEVLFSRFREKCRVIDYNKIAFVPKTAKTDRSIAVEPSLNTFVQMGVDKFLKSRLRRYGVDLQRQDLNSSLAKAGSADHHDSNPFCTIDLSAASDSLSIQLCKLLLPPDWFEFLNALRSHHYLNEGVETRYEKFCSMGNGFCFPLESLIFAALAHSVCVADRVPSEVRVYGDDIIVRRRAALSLIPLLSWCGFEVNSEKTFLWGPFRESCGTDYFEGVNVRPYVLDEIPDNYQVLIKIANGLSSNLFIVPLEAFWLVLDWIPRTHRFVRPYAGNPDTAVTVPLDYFMASGFARWDFQIQNWTWVEVSTRPVMSRKAYSVATLMYGLLRGTSANNQGLPKFALRRMARTRVVSNHNVERLSKVNA